MNFGEALEGVKKGRRAGRSGWNGKGMFIFLNPGAVPGIVKSPFVNSVSIGLFDVSDAQTTVRMPNINLRAADGSTVTGWLASQTDMLAEDWELL